ncbi:hypothetical protein [Bifidobacterium tissieri]|uniref:Uncharacterized protein n=1 Tax=Bifidobacterium tissieri TaxID=1630162 RepID=A0A5M9ZSP4_9BIFI|nr:hypothetical protein [Bifidobacterium tissieri]KAA8830697.1 hypothetical protein EMO89_04335 [Bifidobacterium tissieri]KAA8831761.1 hypothetical protein EM849_07025 [Bifidobacterium tissieri]
MTDAEASYTDPDEDLYDAELIDDDDDCRACPFKANKDKLIPGLITAVITVASIVVGVYLQYAITKVAVKDALRESIHR